MCTKPFSTEKYNVISYPYKVSHIYIAEKKNLKYLRTDYFWRAAARQGLCKGERTEDQGDDPSLHRGFRARLPAEGGGANVFPEGNGLGRSRGLARVPLPSKGREFFVNKAVSYIGW